MTRNDVNSFGLDGGCGLAVAGEQFNLGDSGLGCVAEIHQFHLDFHCCIAIILVEVGADKEITDVYGWN
jgi:hypothetical protein